MLKSASLSPSKNASNFDLQHLNLNSSVSMRARRRVYSLCFWSEGRGFRKRASQTDRSTCREVIGRSSTLFETRQSRLQLGLFHFGSPTSVCETRLLTLQTASQLDPLWAVHVCSACSVFGFHHGMHVHFQKQQLRLSEFRCRACPGALERQTEGHSIIVCGDPSPTSWRGNRINIPYWYWHTCTPTHARARTHIHTRSHAHMRIHT